MSNDKNSPRLASDKLGTQPIWKLLINLAVPSAVGYSFIVLDAVLNTAFVAQLGEKQLASVSFAYPMQYLLMAALVVGFMDGFVVSVSGTLAKRDSALVSKTIGNAILLQIVMSALCLLFGLFGVPAIISATISDAEMIRYGVDYLSVVYMLAFVPIMQYTAEGLLLVTGQSRLRMICECVMAAISVTLAPIMIFGLFGMPRMEVIGAAMSTVMGQAAACLLAVFFNVKYNKEVKLYLRSFIPSRKIMVEILRIAIPSVAQYSMTSIGTYGLNMVLLTFGSVAVAIHIAFFRVQTLIIAELDAISDAIKVVLPYNLNDINSSQERRNRRVRATIYISVCYGGVVTGVGFLVFQFFPAWLVGFFNPTEDMLNAGVTAFRILSMQLIFFAFTIPISAMFRAFKHTNYGVWLTFIRQLVLLVPLAYLLSLTDSLNITLWALSVSNLVASVIGVVLLQRILRKQDVV